MSKKKKLITCTVFCNNYKTISYKYYYDKWIYNVLWEGENGMDEKINRKHTISIIERERISITGIKEVFAFDENEIELETTRGCLYIKGEGLHVVKMNIDDGELIVEGFVVKIEYNDSPNIGAKKGGFLSKLFKWVGDSMNQIVCNQSELFFISIQIGVVIGIIFDVIRIFRKTIRHHNFIVQIEDMLFWVCSGFTGFYMLYNCNYADIRPYILIGILMGACFYFLTFSIIVMKVMTYIVEISKRILHKAYRIVMKPIYKMVEYIIIPIERMKKAKEVRKHNRNMRYREKLRKQYQLDADSMTESYIKSNRI